MTAEPGRSPNSMSPGGRGAMTHRAARATHPAVPPGPPTRLSRPGRPGSGLDERGEPHAGSRRPTSRRSLPGRRRLRRPACTRGPSPMNFAQPLARRRHHRGARVWRSAPCWPSDAPGGSWTRTCSTRSPPASPPIAAPARRLILLGLTLLAVALAGPATVGPHPFHRGTAGGHQIRRRPHPRDEPGDRVLRRHRHSAGVTDHRPPTGPRPNRPSPVDPGRTHRHRDAIVSAKRPSTGSPRPWPASPAPPDRYPPGSC